MSALLHIFRPSRKLVAIIGGVALLIGCSGVFALYIGKERLLGFAAASPNGLKCSDVNLVTIRKDNRFWVRKYIRTDPTDGLTRVRTALRVAKAVYDEQRPDLVQVVVLDQNGPTLRSDIRGRALGADVVYVPHPDKVADGAAEAPVTARYYNGGASAEGLFYGEQINMLPKDIDDALAALNDHSDCDDPLAAENGAGGSAKKDKQKAAEAAEQKAVAREEKEEAPATPPEQNPPASTRNLPPEGNNTGSFIGADAAEPHAAPSPGLDPTMTGASNRRSPVTN
ncbi:hypothetical protein [Rhizobium sp. BR 362]|uniref:hypothetical protein n=1 Tax=Rhizobium sp. BR 362 TaxID=3040670 RepID=UPI002F3FC67A